MCWVVSGEGQQVGTLRALPTPGVCLGPGHTAPQEAQLSLLETFGTLVRVREGRSSMDWSVPWVHCPGPEGALLIGQEGLEVIVAAPPLACLQASRSDPLGIRSLWRSRTSKPGWRLMSRGLLRRRQQLSALLVICGPAGTGSLGKDRPAALWCFGVLCFPEA